MIWNRILVIVRHFVECGPFLALPLPLEVLRGTDRGSGTSLPLDGLRLELESSREGRLGPGPLRIVRIEFRHDCSQDSDAGSPKDPYSDDRVHCPVFDSDPS